MFVGHSLLHVLEIDGVRTPLCYFTLTGNAHDEPFNAFFMYNAQQMSIALR